MATANELLEQDTFDVLDFVSGASMPTDEITIYTDADAGYKLSAIFEAERERIAKAEEAGKNKKKSSLSLADDDGSAALEEAEEEINRLTELLEDSKITFHLRGLKRERLEEIEEKLAAEFNFKDGDENPDYFAAYNYTVFGETISHVINAKGNKGRTVWTAETVGGLNVKLHPTQWEKLWGKVIDVNYSTNIFDGLVTADF